MLQSMPPYQKGWKKPTMPFHSLSAGPCLAALPGGVFPTFSQSSSSFFLFVCCASNVLVSLATLASNNSLRVREDRRRCCPTISAAKRRVLGRKTVAKSAGTSSERKTSKRPMSKQGRVGKRWAEADNEDSRSHVQMFGQSDSCSGGMDDIGSWRRPESMEP
jgi:hypothetical protein